ncbi:unnamed protein product, partial [Amoebophrya sp. A120]
QICAKEFFKAAASRRVTSTASELTATRNARRHLLGDSDAMLEEQLLDLVDLNPALRRGIRGRNGLQPETLDRYEFIATAATAVLQNICTVLVGVFDAAADVGKISSLLAFQHQCCEKIDKLLRGGIEHADTEAEVVLTDLLLAENVCITDFLRSQLHDASTVRLTTLNMRHLTQVEAGIKNFVEKEQGHKDAATVFIKRRHESRKSSLSTLLSGIKNFLFSKKSERD